jgi:hypothetical protein
MSGGIIVSVMAEAAIYNISRFRWSSSSITIRHTGAMTEALIPYFAPSFANVFVNATRPIFAAL